MFIPLVGQFDNIGDVLLRRTIAEWLAPHAQLHVYLGKFPEGYDAGLQLGDAVVYRSFTKWYWAGFKAVIASRRTSYVFKPGEIQLTFRGLKEHVGMLPLLFVMRRRGGSIIRVGVGARNFAQVPGAFIRPSIALSHITYWRDTKTAEFFGGKVMPDLAFGQSGAGPSAAREVGVISLRSDRPLPSDEWFSAVSGFLGELGLTPIIVTQVKRDDSRSAHIADRMTARLVPWLEGAHHHQEDLLREVYGRARVVISDRLHVLIAATIDGALPIAALTDHSDKIERHFDAVGMGGVSFSTVGMTAPEVLTRLRQALKREEGLEVAKARARDQLMAIRSEVVARVTGEAPE